MKKPVVAITVGDYNGIGPEILLKTFLNTPRLDITPVIMGHPSIFEFYKAAFNLTGPFFKSISTHQEAEQDKINILPVGDDSDIRVEPGRLSEHAGLIAMKSVETALDWCKTGRSDAMVTSPISKEAVNKAGWQIPGHTEFLAKHTDCDNFMMMLVNDDLRVGLISIHDPLYKVPSRISEERILHITSVMNRSLREDFGLENPRIAVLGLNPHAGDGGFIGKEEINSIQPAIEKAVKNNIKAEGPFAADGFFGNKIYQQFNGIIAMYHDQGLIPFKTLSFNAGVNFTAGLPIIRTSPDHGTAFNIAGTFKASEQSFVKALRLAGQLALNKRKRE